ncbi:MAG TPA: heavy-metal-associated domain-containing protein [Trebonia sp.]
MTTTTYQVAGMTCEHCVRAVTQELGDVPGVTAVSVTLVPGGESEVTVTSEASPTTEAIEAALEEAGDYRLAGTADSAEANAAHAVTAAAERTLPLA